MNWEIALFSWTPGSGQGGRLLTTLAAAHRMQILWEHPPGQSLTLALDHLSVGTDTMDGVLCFAANQYISFCANEPRVSSD